MRNVLLHGTLLGQYRQSVRAAVHTYQRLVRSFATLFVLSAFTVNGSVAFGQLPVEYFQLGNRSDDTLWVYLRAKDPGSPHRDWQEPVAVKPSTLALIPLLGFEPFDIAIRTKDGNYLVANDVPLCSWMRECEATGRTEYPLSMRTGRYVDGEFRYDHVQHTKMFRAAADGANVRLDLKLVDFDPPRKPRLPSRK